MQFTQYVEESLKNPALIETVPQRIYRITSIGSRSVPGFDFSIHPVFKQGPNRIYGMSEVLHSLVDGFQRAGVSYKRGQAILFLLTGPPGSGKSELGKKIEDLLINDNDENTRYTFSIGDKKCPVNEDPINLLTSKASFVPREIREQFNRGEYPQLCPDCVNEYTELLAKGKNSDADFYKLLDDHIKLSPLPPRFASSDITREDFPENVLRAARSSNRGLLHIDINDRSFKDIPAASYQALLKLGDGKIITDDGQSFTPDVVTFLYSNWKKKNLQAKGREAFSDRVYPVEMRWNLSWKEELDLYRTVVLSVSHTNFRALEGFAKVIVGSRFDLADENSEEITSLLRRYSMYEEGNPALPDEEKEGLIERMRTSADGRVKHGISIRQSLRLLPGISPEIDPLTSLSCLSPGSVLAWIENFELPESLKSSGKSEIELQCISDVVLSLMYCVNGVKSKEDLHIIDDIFEKYLEIFQNSFAENLEVVYANRRMPALEALADLESKLGVDMASSIDFRNAIVEFMDEQLYGNKRLPTFLQILNRGPSIINSALNSNNYLPWSKMAGSDQLAPLESNRRDYVKRIMIDMMDYCNVCADEALIIASNWREK